MAKKNNQQSTYANTIGSCTVNVDPNDNWSDYMMKQSVDVDKSKIYADTQSAVQQSPYTYMDAAPVVTVRPRHGQESVQQVMNIRQKNIIEQQKRYNEAWKQRIAMMLDNDEEEPIPVSKETNIVSTVKENPIQTSTVADKVTFRENKVPENKVENVVPEPQAEETAEPVVENAIIESVYDVQETEDDTVEPNEDIKADEEIMTFSDVDESEIVFNAEDSFTETSVLEVEDKSEENEIITENFIEDCQTPVTTTKKRGRPAKNASQNDTESKPAKKTSPKKTPPKKPTTKKPPKRVSR